MTVKELMAELREADPRAIVVIEPSEPAEGRAVYEMAGDAVHMELMFLGDDVVEERNLSIGDPWRVKKQAFVIRA